MHSRLSLSAYPLRACLLLLTSGVPGRRAPSVYPVQARLARPLQQVLSTPVRTRLLIFAAARKRRTRPQGIRARSSARPTTLVFGRPSARQTHSNNTAGLSLHSFASLNAIARKCDAPGRRAPSSAPRLARLACLTLSYPVLTSLLRPVTTGASLNAIAQNASDDQSIQGCCGCHDVSGDSFVNYSRLTVCKPLCSLDCCCSRKARQPAASYGCPRASPTFSTILILLSLSTSLRDCLLLLTSGVPGRRAPSGAPVHARLAQRPKPFLPLCALDCCCCSQTAHRTAEHPSPLKCTPGHSGLTLSSLVRAWLLLLTSDS